MPGKAVHGISIEDPALFSYGGRWYYFLVWISNPDESLGVQVLDNKNLEVFEYTNEINSLCLQGRIKYHDLDGSISRFFNRTDNIVRVACTQMKKVQDGKKIEMFYPAGRQNNEDNFAHEFIVQNMGIVDRNKQNITYEIKLVSSLWYSMCANITFSNYPLPKKGEKESEETPVNGFKILKKILAEALSDREDVTVDVSSFDEVASTSTSKIPLITNGGDTPFTIIPYIFDRLYYNRKQMEKSLRYIVFDVVGGQYRCLDYSNMLNWSQCVKPDIILSMFETSYEQDLFSVNNKLGAVVGKRATDTYKDMFNHIVWEYDPNIGDFDNASTNATVDTKTITNLMNSRDVSQTEAKDKYTVELRPEFFTKKDKYNAESALWNNPFSFYNDLLGNLMKKDAIIVNTEGDITHQPGAAMSIVLDRTLDKVPELTAEQKKELYQKHRQIEGTFPILKVQHIYSPMTRPDKGASYTENVVLGRNFDLKTPS